MPDDLRSALGGAVRFSKAASLNPRLPLAEELERLYQERGAFDAAVMAAARAITQEFRKATPKSEP